MLCVVWQLCHALPKKIPDWTEPLWMTKLKRLTKDPAHEEVPKSACAERDVPPVPHQDLAQSVDVPSAQVAQHLDVGREESDRLSPEKPKKVRCKIEICHIA